MNLPTPTNSGGLTLEELKAMGAKPTAAPALAPTGGLTLQQLQAMGAKPIAPALPPPPIAAKPAGVSLPPLTQESIGENYRAGKINKTDLIIQGVGEAAGKANEVLNAPYSPIGIAARGFAGLSKILTVPGEKIAEMIGNTLGSYAHSAVGDKNADKVGKVIEKYGDPIAQGIQHTIEDPSSGGTLHAVGNIGALAGTVVAAAEGAKGLGKAKDMINEGAAFKRSTDEGIANIADQEKGIVPAAKAPTAEAIQRAHKTWEVIQPKLKPSEMADAAAEGRLVREGETGRIVHIPQKEDVEMIKVAEPYVVAAEGDPIQSAANIKQGIAQKAEALREAVGKEGGTFSKSNVKGVVNEVKVPLAIKDGAEMTAVNNIKEYVTSLSDKVEKSAGGALDLARAFRSGINSEYGEAIWGKDTPIAKYIRDVNQALNRHAESLLPDGKLPDGSTIKDSHREQTLLFRVLDNLQVPKVGTSEINPTEPAPLRMTGSPLEQTIEEFAAEHPMLKKGLEAGAKMVGLGEAVKWLP